MLLKKLKTIFRIEYILILISVFAFTSTLIFKNAGTKNLYELDFMISELEVDFSNDSNNPSFLTDTQNYCDTIWQRFLPLTYYNETIENQLGLIISHIKNFSTSNVSAEVFMYLAQEKDIYEISKMLGKSDKTVANQKSLIYQKMNITDRLDVIRMAKKLGVIL